MSDTPSFTPSCPIPNSRNELITLAHGGGGSKTQSLLDNVFRPLFSNDYLNQSHDGAVVPTRNQSAFTTDSYVVEPLFFPGGDIGSLSVNGTVNDLAMCGAQPLYLSASFIIQEGLPLNDLIRIAQSMANAAAAARVKIVTGDTKVIEQHGGAGLMINTAGVGSVEVETELTPRSVEAGDVILLSGDVGRHGIAVMAKREGLDFQTDLESDCAGVAKETLELIRNGIDLHCLRDPTRGGLASILVEIARDGGFDIQMDEMSVPVHDAVRGAAEILGLDPLYIPCEGRFVAFLPEAQASRAVRLLNAIYGSPRAKIIGSVKEGTGIVSLQTQIGSVRALDLLSGEQLPRIC